MEDALLALQESLARFAEMGDRPHTAHVRLELARTYLDRGRLSDARSEISIASELLGDAAESVNAGLVLLLSGILQRLAQDYPQSERSLEEARRIFTAVGRDSGLAECHGELAVFYLETGRTELASEHLRTALRLARRLEMHGLVRDCVAQLARLDELALVRTLVDCVIQDRQSLGAPGGPCGPSAIADFAAIPEN
jgi:tetratricopeptide (TPR) repeat protein